MSIDQPAFAVRPNLPPWWLLVIAGWLVGAVLSWLLAYLLQTQLNGCSGHALLGLLMPFLLGPCGLGLAAWGYLGQRPQVSLWALGLVLASLWPALSLGVRHMAQMRGQGCGGGYFVLKNASDTIGGTLSLQRGESLSLSGNIGGYVNSNNSTERFELTIRQIQPPLQSSTKPNSAGTKAQLTTQLSQQQVKIGQVFQLKLAADAELPPNVYTIKLSAKSLAAGSNKTANQKLEVTVHR